MDDPQYWIEVVFWKRSVKCQQWKRDRIKQRLTMMIPKRGRKSWAWWSESDDEVGRIDELRVSRNDTSVHASGPTCKEKREVKKKINKRWKYDFVSTIYDPASPKIGVFDGCIHLWKSMKSIVSTLDYPEYSYDIHALDDPKHVVV